MPDTQPVPSSKNRMSFSLDYRIIILVLLAVIAAMLASWKPWHKSSAADRTVTVTGQATITTEPDEFVFYPTYKFNNPDKTAALKELTKKSDEIVAKIKSLGIKDNKIKTNSSGNDYPFYYEPTGGNSPTYTLSLTITASSKEEAQKVQDYLVTTNPSGAVSPQASFSDAKRRELESQARDRATKDARAKADQSAKNLGFRVGAVKSIEDAAGFNIYPLMKTPTADVVRPEASTGLTVHPGENDLNYSVTVVYFIR